MAKETTQQLIDERMAELPEISRRAIKESDWEKKLQQIGYRHGLLLDEIELVHAETLILMLGLSEPEMFIDNLKHHAGLEDEIAKKMNDQIHDEIFAPIYEYIRDNSKEALEKHNEDFEPVNTPQKTAIPVKPQTPEQSSQPKRNDVLNDIENPPKSKPSVSRLKMEDLFAKPASSSTESQQKTPPVSPEPVKAPTSNPTESTPKEYTDKSVDPYLEPID